MKHPLHPVWKSLLKRCYNPNSQGYKYWGGAGIVVCERYQLRGMFEGYARCLTREEDPNIQVKELDKGRKDIPAIQNETPSAKLEGKTDSCNYRTL